MTGRKLTTYHPDGSFTVEDTRALEEAKALRVAQLDAEATNDIESVYPQYVQINAALGLYDEARTSEILTGIQERRTHYSEKLAQINAALTNDQVDAVKW